MKTQLLSIMTFMSLCFNVNAETQSIDLAKENLDEHGVYPKIVRLIQIEEANVMRKIDKIDESSYLVTESREIIRDYENLPGYCNKGDIAVSATCSFDKGVDMGFLLNSNNETDEIIGIGCEFAVAERFTPAKSYGTATLQVVCIKK